MKKKKVLIVVLIALFLSAICAVVLLRHSTAPKSEKVQAYSSIEEANEAADFILKSTDRLCGYPATDYEASNSTIEIKFADAGFVRKTLNVSDNRGDSSKYAESTEQSINGRSVTFKGNDSKVYLAEWNENNFTYTIHINEGVQADEMTEYVEATR